MHYLSQNQPAAAPGSGLDGLWQAKTGVEKPAFLLHHGTCIMGFASWIWALSGMVNHQGGILT
jgi:hypothetical protein